MCFIFSTFRWMNCPLSVDRMIAALITEGFQALSHNSCQADRQFPILVARVEPRRSQTPRLNLSGFSRWMAAMAVQGCPGGSSDAGGSGSRRISMIQYDTLANYSDELWWTMMNFQLPSFVQVGSTDVGVGLNLVTLKSDASPTMAILPILAPTLSRYNFLSRDPRSKGSIHQNKKLNVWNREHFGSVASNNLFLSIGAAMVIARTVLTSIFYEVFRQLKPKTRRRSAIGSRLGNNLGVRHDIHGYDMLHHQLPASTGRWTSVPSSSACAGDDPTGTRTKLMMGIYGFWEPPNWVGSLLPHDLRIRQAHKVRVVVFEWRHFHWFKICLFMMPTKPANTIPRETMHYVLRAWGLCFEWPLLVNS